MPFVRGYYVDDAVVQTYKDVIEQLRTDIGRFVTINLIPDISNKIQCPNCQFDSINMRSAGIFSPASPYPNGYPGPYEFYGGSCLVCKGDGYISVSTTANIVRGVAFIKYDPDKLKDLQLIVPGETRSADVRIKMNIAFRPALLKADTVIVDNHICYPLGYSRESGLRDISSTTLYLTFQESVINK